MGDPQFLIRTVHWLPLKFGLSTGIRARRMSKIATLQSTSAAAAAAAAIPAFVPLGYGEERMWVPNTRIVLPLDVRYSPTAPRSQRECFHPCLVAPGRNLPPIWDILPTADGTLPVFPLCSVLGLMMQGKTNLAILNHHSTVGVRLTLEQVPFAARFEAVPLHAVISAISVGTPWREAL